MKKSKLIMSVASLCLAIAVLCFGVYAVQTVNYSLSGNITYEVTDAFVEVQTKVYKSTSYLTPAQLGQKVNEIAEASVTTAPTGLTLVDTSAVSNSTSGTLIPYTNGDLSFSTQAGSECYAYFFVTNIKNMSTEQNVWAVMQDDLTSPSNTVQINNGLQQTIDTNGKNMVIGVGLDDLGTSIPSGTSSEFSYGIKIGIGDLAMQQFNLAKLNINGSTVKANRSNMNGVVVIPDKNPTTDELITTINGLPYSNTSSTEGFANTDFTTIAMEDNIQTINNSVAFASNQHLTNVILAKNLTSIGDSTFFGCTALTSITIPSSVTSIGSSAFGRCSGLEKIIVETGNTAYTSRDESGNEVDCLIETSTSKLIAGCKNSVFPTDGSVTSIGKDAFRECTGLTSITIPDGVTSIGNDAFAFCTRLTSIAISNSVSSLGNFVFNGCTGLTSITIPSSVTSIGDYAFNKCTSLTEIVNNSTSISSSAAYTLPTISGKSWYKGDIVVTKIDGTGTYYCR